MKVKLNELIEGMEMQSEEEKCFLNLNTGEVVYVSKEALTIAEEGEDNDLPDWDEVKLATTIVEDLDNFAELPSRFDINEYNIMEDFCFSRSNDGEQDVLLSSIRNKGAFRKFKDKIHQFGIQQQWYEYRYNRYKKIAIEFCKDHDVDYIE